MAHSGSMSPKDMLVFYDVRRGSSASSHSLLTAPDHDSRLFPVRAKNADWGSDVGSQNLTSVLNDPHTPRSQTDWILTKDWGSSFVETAVLVEPVSVTRRQLEFMRSFLKAVKKRAKTVHRFSQLTQSSAATRRSAVPHQNIDKIPEIFLRKDFDLANVNTFESVLRFSSRCQSDGKAEVTGDTVSDAQRRLSDTLDLVEDSLSNQISARFRDFFHIMNAMDILMEQVSRTIREVTAVRGKCDQLRQALVRPSIQNILLTRVRDNARLYLSKLLLMDSMYQSNSRINSLLKEKDYIASLQLIASSRQVMDKELAGVSCFRHLSSELSERVKLIEKFLDEDLNKLLTTEWLQPFDPSSPSAPILTEDEALFNIIGGMVRIRKFNFVDEFQEEACAAVITVIKQTLIQALAGEDFDVSNRLESHLYNQMKVVELKKWLDIVDETLCNLKILLRRISAVNQVILKTLHSAAGMDWPSDPESCPFIARQEVSLTDDDFQKWSAATTESLVYLCDFTQSRCSKLIDGRLSDSNDRLSFTDFSSFAKSIQSFGAASEFLSGRPCPHLNSVLQAQAEKFASRFHEEKKKKLNSLLDIEQWKSMESVSREFHFIVRQIIEGRVNGNKSACTNNIPEKDGSGLMVQGEKFLVVNSVVLLVTEMFEYWTTSADMPILSSDLLLKLLDLLKHFNSRTNKLVLLGNAKQVAGLKSVTSRTLINSARALELILLLLPRIKLHFKSILSEGQKNLVKHFAEISCIYQEHVDRVHEKVVSSSSEFISAKLSKWEAKPPVPSPLFVAVTQHLSLLDANLEESLPPGQLSAIFGRIDASFKDSLREHLKRLNIVNDGGPQHGYGSFPQMHALNAFQT